MKKYDKKYILGLDIGISSVGWGMLEVDDDKKPCRIIAVGSRIFSPGEVEKTGDSKAKERREKRGARRISRRREFRVDRVRNLLFEEGYLQGTIKSNIVSEKNNELTEIYSNMIRNYYKTHNTNPYILKTEALDRKLTNDELCIILVHYAKRRGYKSNREDGGDKEAGKVINAIKENEELLKKYRTVSEMYVKDEKFKFRIKNSPNDYKVSVTNEMYADEINKVLDAQILFGLITKNFKDDYIDIWSSRRHYAKGPGGNSLYGGDLIARMTGTCKYDDLPRAPKYAYSTETFVALSKLVNLRYKFNGCNEYISLNCNEISDIMLLAKKQKKISYNTIAKALKKDNVVFKGLQLSKNDYVKVIDEFKKKFGITKDAKVVISTLKDDLLFEYRKIYQNKLLSKVFIELKGYHQLKDLISKCFGKEYFESMCDNYEILDELALISTNYKTDDDIKNYIIKSSILYDEFQENDFIKGLPNFKDHSMLSTDLIKKLIPYLEQGMRYDEALIQICPDYKDINAMKEKNDLLAPIVVNKSIRNQRVIRSLSQTRKVINAIIKKCGLPYAINVETARELAKTMQERNQIKKMQEDHKSDNDKTKEYLVSLGIFNSVDAIKGTDLLKYRLWKEQNEFCAYSLEKITIEELFDKNMVQIDHILPYSRTFNDSILNKTLVKTRYNQLKGNKTPYEWLTKDKWHKFENYINSLDISQKKKDNYLLKDLTSEICREMQNQNLNDTKYISRELASMLKAYLNVDNINVYQGALTAKLRARWGFNRLTHSFISETYYLPKDMKEDIKKDRDNHLHHALDALVIAANNKSLQQKVTLYEKFSRYVDGISKSTLNSMDYDEIVDDENIEYDEETGVVNDVKFRDYIEEEVSKNHIYFSKHNVAQLKFPLPYETFAEEAKIRVYQQDINALKKEIALLHTYSNDEIEDIKVLTPSIAKNKISGAMHEETYYGMKKVGEEIKKTIRKPLENIKLKDLETLPDIQGGSRDIYDAVRTWMDGYENGADALKAHNGKYPINKNDKEQKEIKKLKIYLPYKNTGHFVNGSNVEKGSVQLIEIFKSEDIEDDKLYFVAFDMFDVELLRRFKKGENVDFNVKIEWAQGDKNKVIKYSDLIKEYDLYLSLRKNDLIKAVNRKNEEITAYVVGFTSGMFEVKSKIGDGYDLIGENKIFSKHRTQYCITVSTIKSIKKLSINTLGEINGL